MRRHPTVATSALLPNAVTCLLLAAALACGCGGYGLGPDGVYRGPQASFRIGTLDAQWRRVRGCGTDVAFHHPGLGAIIEAHVDCRGSDAPLSALTRHLLIGFTDRAVLSQKLVTVDGREAMRTIARAKLDGVPVALDLLVVKKNGCTYDLTYSVPPDRYARGVPDFERFVQGFRVLAADGS